MNEVIREGWCSREKRHGRRGAGGTPAQGKGRERHSEKVAVCKPRREPAADTNLPTLDLGFPACSN